MSAGGPWPNGLDYYYIPRSSLNPHGTYAIVDRRDMNIDKSCRSHLAEITGWGDGSTRERKVPPQVDLFAASPDLLACLKETLAIAARNEEGAFADRARAAIARAEGSR